MTRKIELLNPVGILFIFLSAFLCDADAVSFEQAAGMVLCGMLCMGTVWAWKHIFFCMARREKKDHAACKRTIVSRASLSGRRRAA